MTTQQLFTSTCTSSNQQLSRTMNRELEWNDNEIWRVLVLVTNVDVQSWRRIQSNHYDKAIDRTEWESTEFFVVLGVCVSGTYRPRPSLVYPTLQRVSLRTAQDFLAINNDFSFHSLNDKTLGDQLSGSKRLTTTISTIDAYFLITDHFYRMEAEIVINC